MKRSLYEIVNGAQTTANLAEIALVFDSTKDPDIVLTLSSTQNKKLTSMTRKIVIEAALDNSTSKRYITFDLQILYDCSNYPRNSVLTAGLEVINKSFTIGLDAATSI